MLTHQATELLATLRRTLHTWDCTVDGDCVLFKRQRNGPYRPPRHAPSWHQLLDAHKSACERYGIARGSVLPLHGCGDADLTFSAVQALDPYLKRRQPHIHSKGLIPQPVVRFTGDRDRHGALMSGFLSSFINVSIVQPISTIGEHAALIDTWLAVLSRLGFHAQHMTIAGSLTTWTWREVSGITLRFRHDDLTLGDATLLWNADDPTFLATDIGSGMERLRWALTRQPWPEVVYGKLTEHGSPCTLDALRTATLIVGSGIPPASRGPGSAVRRLLRPDGEPIGGLGFSRVIRWAHDYWSLVQSLPVPGPEVCRLVEAEVFDAS